MSLELQGVSKVVDGQLHIAPTDLLLEKGTMNVLLGPTSSGKTSLMRLMAGLDKPSTGRILSSGTDVTTQRVQARNVAMVYQEFINYPGMTVYDNIASPLRLKGESKREIDRAVRASADMLKLTPFLQRRPLSLSGGQQQRCALARALVKEAELVLLDEPLANLDYKLREELRAEIPRIFEQAGSIFVYATTEPEEALLLGGNTATLWEGQVTQFGATLSVYRQPATLITARVFSDPPMNFIAGLKAGDSLSLARSEALHIPDQWAGLSDGTYTVGFRAHHIKIQRPEVLESAPQAAHLHCTLVAIEVTGSETFLHLKYGEVTWVAVVPGLHTRAVGEVIDLWLDIAHLYLFDAAGCLVACGDSLG
ncbi:MAG: ABC transporter ATP-binding protein [Luminiphilus sp.]|nr:ABC transporter ATP-binding protein [Luminiphilus sp.]